MLNRVQPRKLVYSTVSESLINEGFFREGFIINSDSVFLCFTLLITSCRLTKTYHYNDNQERIFKIVKHLKNQYKYSNKRISEYLNSNGFLTTRTKRDFRPNDIYSLYKKGMIRKNRIDRTFEMVVSNVRIIPI